MSLMEMQLPRLMVAGSSSGCGKTSVSCALIRLLSRRGLDLRAFKCGPDYLDPTFHSDLLGVPSRNLDLFMADEGVARQQLAEASRGADLALIEGVMGYFDGVASTDEASSWALACATQTPTVLVADARGRSLSLVAELAGFSSFRQPSQLVGVILNGASDGYFPQLKEAIERETSLEVLGHLPRREDASLESRHLGLVAAYELDDLQGRIDRLADALEERLDLERLLALAAAAPALAFEPSLQPEPQATAPTIAVARDVAFSFYYQANLELLERLGARLTFFSPLTDERLPQGISGLYLGGGYPELHAEQLAANAFLRGEIAGAIERGLPTIAECGGYLYLHEKLVDEQGRAWPMVGALAGSAAKGASQGRFGYVTLRAHEDGLIADAGQELRAHEFHRWQSDRADDAFTATKPYRETSWEGCVHTPTLYAGFPHLFFPGCPSVAKRFVHACARFAAVHEGRGA